MRLRTFLLSLLSVTIVTTGVAAEIVNPAIDMDAFLRVAAQAAGARSTRRVSEEDFVRIAGQQGAVILDARSSENFVSFTSVGL